MGGTRKGWLHVIGPGILVAATGVGAGDLATAGFAGSALGVGVLWVVAVGAFVKFVLSEGLARWQLVTGETLLEGVLTRTGRPGQIAFGAYLLPWSFFVGAALISACAATSHAILDWTGLAVPPLLLGALHSGLGAALVFRGGYRLVERVMAVCIGVMFASVVVTAVLVGGDPAAILRGLFVPTIPDAAGSGLTWSIGLMGGVGGTLTLLCYGYWIREEGRTDAAAVRVCRIDLAAGFTMTALFGMALIVIAARIPEGAAGAKGGVGLIVALGDELNRAVGPGGRGIFLVGAWAAVFSSLLGVWQAVPYIFADYVRISLGPPGVGVRTTGRAYRGFLVALAIVPLLQVHHPFREVQKWYVLVGAAFIPLLALVLLVFNARRDLMGEARSRPLTTVVLVAVLLLSGLAAAVEIQRRFG